MVLPPVTRLFASAASHRESAVYIALATAALWLLNHPYVGIKHDGVLYAVMALHWLHPEAYARDVWFMFGSQDDFTIFSPFYGALIGLLGLPDAAQWVTLAGAFLWLGAFCALARCASPDLRWIGLVAMTLAVTELNYSPNHDTFVMSEAFATARSLAAPLAILGVAAGVAGRWKLAAPLLALAAAFHPLLGGWAALLAVGVLLGDRLLLAAVAVGGIALAALAAVGGVGSLVPMDAAWLDVVRASARDVFADEGGRALRLPAFAFWLGALLLGGSLGSEPYRRWYRVCALMVVLAYGLALLSGLWMPLKLLVQVQLWRALWLGASLGLFALLDVGWRAMVGDSRQRWLALSAFSLGMLVDTLMPWLLLAGALALASSAVRRGVGALVDRAESFHPVALPVLATIICILAVPHYLAELALLGGARTYFGWPSETDALVGFILAGGIGLGSGVMSLVINGRFRRPAAVALLLPALGFAIAGWDQRHGPQGGLEQRLADRTAPWFEGSIRPGDVVYWEDNIQSVWFGLGTASYASGNQAVGIVFSRERMTELWRRLQRVAVASVADQAIGTESDARGYLAKYRALHRIDAGGVAGIGNLHAYDDGRITPHGLRYLCADRQLDWVVSPDWLGAQGNRREYAIGNKRLFLYDCGAFNVAE